MPKVSVIVPTYNREKMLPDVIEGVLSQTFKDYELIIVDDGSTDNTKSLVQKYIDSDTSKICYIRQNNQGVAIARNTGINNAKGDYFAFLDFSHYSYEILAFQYPKSKFILNFRPFTHWLLSYMKHEGDGNLIKKVLWDIQEAVCGRFQSKSIPVGVGFHR